MLKQLILENWKSFRYAELPLDPLTVLIGTNASGKSNVVEALEFLQRIAQGENVEAALAGNKTLPSIRGGVEWAAFKHETHFTLKVIVQTTDTTDLIYEIQVQTKPNIIILQESVLRETSNDNSSKTDVIITEKNTPKSRILDMTKEAFSKLNSIENILIGQLPEQNNQLLTNKNNLFENRKQIEYLKAEIDKINNYIFPQISNIFTFNPIPSKMRDYSSLSERLESDACNIAGILAALPDEQKTEVELILSNYVKNLPEGDIKKVFAEPVGRLKTDAMLYCEEEWKPGETTLIDAKTMSDGTLRFLAILTALLTRPEGSQLVIEEIDNGLHASRAELLVKILREIGSKRKIDILLTTHNPALLDALGPEIVPFVVVAHRDKETGESKLTLLEDIDNFPKLFASYSLGNMTTKGAIERSLSRGE